MLKNKIKLTGQVLIELIIIIGLFSILASGLAMTISISGRAKQIANLISQARSLIQEYREALLNLSLNSWQKFDILAKGPTNYYKLVKNTSWDIQNGKENLTLFDQTIERYFIVENVYRTIDGYPTTSPTSLADPATLKFTISVKINQTEFKDEILLTRWSNLAVFQAAWGGGPTNEGPVTDFTNQFASSSNIDFYETEIKLSK